MDGADEIAHLVAMATSSGRLVLIAVAVCLLRRKAKKGANAAGPPTATRTAADPPSKTLEFDAPKVKVLEA